MIISAILFALVLGGFIFWVLPRGTVWRRTASVATFVCLIAVVYAGAIEMTSRPKPVSLEWRGIEEASLIGATMKEGEAIYVWLQIDGAAEPRAYTLPWSMEGAQELQQAMSEAETNGTAVRVMKPFESSLDGSEPKFYAMPQPALPEKTRAPGPMVYNRPADAL
jgi:hypothetical protein